MTKTALHLEIEAIAQKRGAMLLSARVIKAAVLDSLRRAILFGGTKVQFPTGNDLVLGQYKAVSVDEYKLEAHLEQIDGGLAVRISPDFVVTLELVAKDDPSLTFCTIDLDARDLSLPVEGEGDLIRFLAPVAPISGRVHASPTRAAAVAVSKIEPDDLLRVEGSIAYGAGPRLVNSAIGQLAPVNLKQLFPALNFAGALEMHEVKGSLLVIPDSFALIGNPGCPKGDAMGGVQIIPQDPARSDEDSRSWPTFTRLPQYQHSQYVASDAYAATYLPRAVLDVHFGKTTPAVAYRDSGNGFIGYEIELTCAIRSITVAIDAAAGGLVLSLGLATWGIVTANVDVPCIGRMDIAQAKFEMPKDNGTADVQALLRLAVDTGARLLVTCEMTKIDLGEAKVDVQLFSKYLGLAGGEKAVYGFILDAVIGRVVASILPGMVSDKIKDEVNQHFFVLADMSSLLKYMYRASSYLPTFSADQNSALMGLAVGDPAGDGVRTTRKGRTKAVASSTK